LWRKLAANILRDQKPIWTFPLKAAHGRHWEPVLAVAGATAGLVALDPHDAPYFRRTGTFHGFNNALSGQNSSLGMIAIPAAAYFAGVARHDSGMEQTALLAGEAVADSEILTFVMKGVDRRLRPSSLPPDGDFSDTWFRAQGGWLNERGSFPSGHTIAAFSIATVFAERYSDHRWVPWVAYGLAALVGMSRITLQAHFPSDVFAGAALGYSISHFVVLRHP
jgi:PAP2 superfamily